MLKVYTLNLAVYVAKKPDEVSNFHSHFFKFLSRSTGLQEGIEELNNHHSFYLPLKDGYYMFYIYYLNSELQDLRTGEIYDSEFYGAAPFDNEAAFDNLILNSKIFNKNK